MKLLRIATMVILSLLINVNVMADDDNQNKPVNTSRIPKLEGVIVNAPRTLCMPYLDCTYNNEYIEFALPDDVNYAEVTLGTDETSTIWSGIITPDFPGCDIPLLKGEYVVTCTLDNGTAYQGVLTF